MGLKSVSIGSAEASDITVGATTITGGTTARFLYDNAGVVGETANITYNSGNLVVTTFVSTGSLNVTDNSSIPTNGLYRASAGVMNFTAGSADVVQVKNAGGALSFVQVAGQTVLKNYTVATLPTGITGGIAYVTDATAPTYLTPLVGGGAVVTPVFYNGSAWVSF